MKTIRTPCRDHDYIGETITEESVAFMLHDAVDGIPSPVLPLEGDSWTDNEVEALLLPTAPPFACVVKVVKARSAYDGEASSVYTDASHFTSGCTTDGATDWGSTHRNGWSVTYSQKTALLDNTTNGNRYASSFLNDKSTRSASQKIPDTICTNPELKVSKTCQFLDMY